MITVVEKWNLKAGLEDRALEIMQEMDNLVGPPAHEHPGWCGHAAFFQSAERPTELLIIYPWKSQELHQALLKEENAILKGFIAMYFVQDREIQYYLPLGVEVEH